MLLKLKPRPLCEASGWRRSFVTGAALLVFLSYVWSWHVKPAGTEGMEFIEFALSIWSISAGALAILVAGLAMLDRCCLWVGEGFGLSSAATRAGAVAVLAGLTLCVAGAILTRYEVVMPVSVSMRAHDLCVVLDRWTGEAKPCTEEAVTRHHRKRPEQYRAVEPIKEEDIMRWIAGLLARFVNTGRWMPDIEQQS